MRSRAEGKDESAKTTENLPAHQKIRPTDRVLPPDPQQLPLFEAHRLLDLKEVGLVDWGREEGVVDLAAGLILGEFTFEEVGLDRFERANGRALRNEKARESQLMIERWSKKGDITHARRAVTWEMKEEEGGSENVFVSRSRRAVVEDSPGEFWIKSREEFPMRLLIS